MRVRSRDRMWDLNAGAIAANPPAKNDKAGKSRIKQIYDSLKTWIPRAELKQQMGTEGAFANRFSKGK